MGPLRAAYSSDPTVSGCCTNCLATRYPSFIFVQERTTPTQATPSSSNRTTSWTETCLGTRMPTPSPVASQTCTVASSRVPSCVLHWSLPMQEVCLRGARRRSVYARRNRTWNNLPLGAHWRTTAGSGGLPAMSIHTLRRSGTAIGSSKTNVCRMGSGTSIVKL